MGSWSEDAESTATKIIPKVMYQYCHPKGKSSNQIWRLIKSFVVANLNLSADKYYNFFHLMDTTGLVAILLIVQKVYRNGKDNIWKSQI